MSALEPWFKIENPQSRFGKSVIVLDTCDSTNDIAMELARTGHSDGTVVIARHQIQGKGRIGRTWQSWPGNIALSLIIRPELATEMGHRLVFASAYGCVSALSCFGICAEIKWPNDILIRPNNAPKIEKLGTFRKVGGILLELTSTHKQIDAAIIGIGLNLVRPPDELPDISLPQIGFIKDLGKPPSVSDLINQLLHTLEQDLADPQDTAKYAQLLEKVKAKSAFLGKKVLIECGQSVICGIAEDLATDGALVVKDLKGNRNHIYYGDVHLA